MPVYVSDRLTATLGVVRGSPTPTRLIQWFRGSTVIAGANASTYTITSDDLGQPISVRQTESNYFGSAVATSAATEDVAVFSPSILFSASEPGVWFDPTDAANLAWRRNLLLWTQEFDNATWVKANGGVGVVPVVTANAGTDPIGGSTADRVQFSLGGGTASSDISQLRQTVQTSNGPTYTFSFWAKSFDGSSSYQIIAFGAPAPAQAVAVTGTWTRFTVTGAGTNTNYSLTLRGGQTPTNSNTADILIWGAQLEESSTATTYQPITDLNTEVIAQFPNATLYQDSIGTIPVYAPEQPVGLMLDKSRGLVLGPEIITNGNFSGGSTGWTAGTTPINWTFAGGAINGVDASGGYQNVGQVISGKSYVAEFTISGWTAGSVSLENAGAGAFGAVFSGDGVKRQFFTAAATATIGFVRRVSNFTGSIDNFSVKELPGNHATQSTAISRPLYGIVPVSGRRNLYTYSQDFTNAAWNKIATLGSTTETAPDGTATASVISNVSNFQAVQRSFGVTGDIVASVFFKKTSGATYFPGFSLQTPTVYRSVALNTNTGVATPRDIEPVPAGEFGVEDKGTFWRVWIRHTALIVTYIYPRVNTDAGAVWTGGNGSQTIWGAQVESSTAPTNYQKVTNDYDVTEAGVASVGYLRFDGTNDFMITSTITPGTDKAQVFTGVRKLADPAAGIIVESSGNVDANNGSILLFTNPNVYGVKLRGTVVPSSINSPSSYTAPITSVVTGLGDIVADINTLRINGAQVAQGTADLGTGNFLSYPLNIGVRSGGSLPFNGQMFPMIVRFGPNMSSALIRTTENWVASKTAGVVLP